jgi:hypothetical protein
MPDEIKFSVGKFYLGDDGYACRSRILSPFRYHLNEFSFRNIPQNSMGSFNLINSILRVNIERAFAALKNRFKVLDQKSVHTYSPKSSWFLLPTLFTTGS